jgi:hypothetical protein
MKACSAVASAHNLNIKMYSFKEILDLFHLSYDFTLEDLKQAKMVVLKMHPDKSRLPSDYFIFYKRAFEVVVDYFNETQKVTKEVPTTEIKYQVDNPDKRIYNTIQSNRKEMGDDGFSKKFNELFEKNMAKKQDPSQNQWFTSNEPIYQYDNITSTAGLGVAMNKIKEKTSALVQYNGIQPMQSSMGNDLYDEENGGAEGGNGQYVSCDVFSKLKFEDLRKVHKDQTVFSVGENDYANMKTYTSIDHLQRERGGKLVPLEKGEAEKMLAEKERAIQQAILAKQHAANLRSMEYAEKNKAVMSNFLRLT